MDWTEKEIKKYIKNKSMDPVLRNEYFQKRIDINDPEGRFKHLLEGNLLKLTIEEDADIRYMVKKKKVKALITLEKAFSELY